MMTMKRKQSACSASCAPSFQTRPGEVTAPGIKFNNAGNGESLQTAGNMKGQKNNPESFANRFGLATTCGEPGAALHHLPDDDTDLTSVDAVCDLPTIPPYTSNASASQRRRRLPWLARLLVSIFQPIAQNVNGCQHTRRKTWQNKKS